MNRYYTDPNLPLIPATRAGLKTFNEQAKADPAKGKLLLVVNGRANFKAIFADFPEKQLVKDLLAGKAVVRENLTISLAVLGDHIHGHNGPVLVIHPSAQQIEEVEKIPGVTDILVLTYIPEDLAAWITAKNPQKVLPVQPPQASPTNPSNQP